MRQHILMTGGTGFVGQNLQKFLDKSYKILNISMREHNWSKQINTGFSAIIHLAGKAHDTSNTSSPQDYFDINRDLTVQLFDKFLDSKINDFFYFSSVKAIADSVDGVLTERVIANPLTPYGKSKLEAEEYLLSKEIPEGKRLFIIRPCMIHGPGNKGNLNLLFNIVKKGIPWPLGAFENQRSFLSIENLCFLIERMLVDKNLKSGVYNFSDDKPLSTNELVVLISKVLDKKPKVWKMNKSILSNLARIGDKISLPLNSERLKKLTESYVVSNQKIKYDLKIDKLPITSEEGLRITINSFKENLN